MRIPPSDIIYYNICVVFIISADSRQIYRGMDLGTGKDLADYTVNGYAIPDFPVRASVYILSTRIPDTYLSLHIKREDSLFV